MSLHPPHREQKCRLLTGLKLVAGPRVSPSRGSRTIARPPGPVCSPQHKVSVHCGERRGLEDSVPCAVGRRPGSRSPQTRSRLLVATNPGRVSLSDIEGRGGVRLSALVTSQTNLTLRRQPLSPHRGLRYRKHRPADTVVCTIRPKRRRPQRPQRPQGGSR